MAWECIIKDAAIADVRKDRRAAKSIEKYNVSEQALYFEGKYLPAARIRSVRIQPSFYHPQATCGKGIPVFKVRVDHGGEAPLILMLERESNAEKLVSMLRAANPSITLEEYVDPLAGETVSSSS